MDASRAALSRLTEGEKACLRRRLSGETAKQSALAMGVSPHAVEKRLKMARAKLGLSSSLAAARLLAEVEAEAGRLVPRSPALAPAAPPAPGTARVHRRALTGALPMLLIALLAALPQTVALPPPPSPAPLPPAEDVTWRAASPEEIRVFVADAFLTMDRDRSGYIERAEAPQGGFVEGPGKVGDPVPARKGHRIEGRAGQAMWIGLSDADDDGRVSLAEWLAYDVPIITRLGKVPANWRGVAAARAAGAGG